EHCGVFSRNFRNVSVRGQPHTGSSLQEDFLDAVTVAWQFTEFFGLQGTRFRWKTTPGGCQLLSQRRSLFAPLFQGLRSAILLMSGSRLSSNEFQKLHILGWRLLGD